MFYMHTFKNEYIKDVAALQDDDGRPKNDDDDNHFI